MENGKSPLRSAFATPPGTLWYVVSLSLFHDFIFASLPLSHICIAPPPVTPSRHRPDAVMPLTDHWPRATSSLSFFLFLLSFPFLSFFLLLLQFSGSTFFSFSDSLLFSASLQLYSSTGKGALLFSASLVSSFIDFEFLLIDFHRGAVRQGQWLVLTFKLYFFTLLLFFDEFLLLYYLFHVLVINTQ